MKSETELAPSEWDFDFPRGELEVAFTALSWEWEFAREINRENGTKFRGTNAWGLAFGHERDIPFSGAVPQKEWVSIWRQIESAWFEAGALGVHDAGIFPSFLTHRIQRESQRTSHRKDSKGRITETAHSFAIRWEIPDKVILQEMRSWLKHHRKSGFPEGKVAKARRQKPWVQICQTELEQLGVYRLWKHHGGKPSKFQAYAQKYAESANYSHAVKDTKKRIQCLLRFIGECIEGDLPLFLS